MLLFVEVESNYPSFNYPISTTSDTLNRGCVVRDDSPKSLVINTRGGSVDVHDDVVHLDNGQ